MATIRSQATRMRRGAVLLALLAGVLAGGPGTAQDYFSQRRAMRPTYPASPQVWPGGDRRPRLPLPGGLVPRDAPPPYYDDDYDEPPPRARRRPAMARPARPPAVVERKAARPAPRPRAPAQATARKAAPRPNAARSGVSGLPPPREARFAPRDVIVEFKGDVDPRAAQPPRRLGLTRLGAQRFALLGATLVRYRLPAQANVRATLGALRGVRSVAFAQPNYLYVLQQSAPAATQVTTGEEKPAPEPKPEPGPKPGPKPEPLPQYAAEALRLSAAHTVAMGAKVKIALIDSRVDASHPELAGAVAASVDLIEDGAAAPEEHGTAVAGAIAARARMQSPAPQAELLAARAFSAAPGQPGEQGATYTILRGLDWAYAQGANVVNMSFAGPPDPLLRRMLAAAAGKGMILVAAAGNEGPRAPALYPAAAPEVIAVTAIDERRRLFEKASGGGHVRLASPGVAVLSAAPNASYGVSTGTSVAAAHVSGVVALLLEKRPRLGAEAIRKTLETSGAALPSDPAIRQTDAAAAVAAVGAQVSP